jgi:hypothetical protein
MVKNLVIDGSKMPLIPGATQMQTKLVFKRGKYQPIFEVVLYGKLQFK